MPHNSSDESTAFPQGLKSIKDCAVALRLAGEYLYDERLLQRMGSRIKADVGLLQEEIEALKKRFVGKPAHEMSVDRELGAVSKFGRMMENPDQALVEKCRRGDLGESLWDKTLALIEAVGELRARIEGKSVPVTGADYLMGVQETLQSSIDHASAAYRFFLKIAVSTVGVGFIALAVLFLTMSGETDLLKKIDQEKAVIRSKTQAISRVDAEINRIRKKVNEMDDLEFSRGEKIDALDLNLKVHGLTEEKEKMQVAIKIEKARLRETENELLEMKRKSFLARLLRK